MLTIAAARNGAQGSTYRGSQTSLDAMTRLGPVFQLSGSGNHLARAPIELSHPSLSRVRVFGPIQAADQFGRQPCALGGGKFQELGENFLTTWHSRQS
jgi:hypothetical protein